MRKSGVTLAFLIVLAMVASVFAHAATPAAAGSFLKHRVYSVQDLVKQVSTENVVTARYTQHFKMNQQSLVAYFQDNLKLSTLKKPTVSTVYYINKSGKIVKSKRLLPTGTPVFVTRSGEAILDGRCGNPLRTDLPRSIKNDTASKKSETKQVAKQEEKKESKTSAVASASSASSETTAPVVEPVVEKVLATNAAEVATLPFATAPAIASEAIAPTVISATPMISTPVVEAIATAPTTALPPVVASAGKSFNYLPWAIIGGLGAAAGLSGGGSGGEKPIVPEQPVPEPAGIATLASGMIGMAAFAFRRRRM